MNIHIVHLPVLQSLASQICMCAPRKAKRLTNDIKINRFWVLNPEVLKRLEVDVLEDDAIFDLGPERQSRWAISVVVGVVAWREPHSFRYADYRVNWSLPDHIWPWALAQTSIFSKNNTEINYKLNYSRTMMFCLFSTHKSSDYASSAKLT